MSRILVWAIHLLTASGAAFALVAAVAASRGAWQIVFVCLGIALIIDGIDGPLARRHRVSERLPGFDGAALDFVVDYATYVFIPAFILAESGLVSEPWATISGVVVAVVGALYFADKRMKTDELGFRGFPAVWNTLVYVLMIYKPPEAVTLIVIAAFAVLTFTPVEFIHPVRVRRLRPLTLCVTFAWAVLAIAALIADLDPGPFIRISLFVATVYLTVIGAVLQLTRKSRTQT